MKKLLLLFLAVVAAVGCFAGCAERQGEESLAESVESSPAQEAQEVPPPESAESIGQESISASPAEASGESSGKALLDSDMATFIVGYNNAQTIELTMRIPDGWMVDSQHFISADGSGSIDFNHISQLTVNGDMNAYWEDVDAEYAGIAIAADLDIPGMASKRYHLQTESADGTVYHEFRYYVCIENISIVSTLIPAVEVDIEAQREEFEACLATVKLGW